MIGQIAVVTTRADPASSNIAERLRELVRWDDQGNYLACENYRLVILDGPLITLERLEDRLTDLGLDPDLLVFASRHQARDEVPRLCCHFTGNSGEATMGGEPCNLSIAAPAPLKSFLFSLENMLDNVPKDASQILLEGFEITAEATHHGPTDLETPAFFVEIGSTKEVWPNKAAGMAVARAILDIEDLKSPIFLGFGGGHYVQRQNRLLRESGICFGHMFSNYQMDDMNIELVEQAQAKSGASYAYLDKKSLRSAAKKNLYDILEQMGIEMMNAKEIKDRFLLDGQS